jgi:hypothetical protein
VWTDSGVQQRCTLPSSHLYTHGASHQRKKHYQVSVSAGIVDNNEDDDDDSSCFHNDEDNVDVDDDDD